MKYVYLRVRKCTWGSFFEFLLVYTSKLVLPSEELPRFSKRIIKTVVLDGHTLALTKSECPSAPSLKTLADIKANGAWCSANDLVPRGGVASYYGLHIDATFDVAVAYNYMQIPECLAHHEPYVVYHGTERSLVQPILKEGLRPTFGMLGLAVYFGSFWKAFRFATLTQDYQKRPGAILRCYAHWPTLVWKPVYSNEWCKCALCATAVNKDFNADHDARWQLFGEAVMAFPRPGHSIKNEEFAAKDASKVFIESIGHAVSNSEHHEPLSRTVIIE